MHIYINRIYNKINTLIYWNWSSKQNRFIQTKYPLDLIWKWNKKKLNNKFINLKTLYTRHISTINHHQIHLQFISTEKVHGIFPVMFLSFWTVELQMKGSFELCTKDEVFIKRKSNQLSSHVSFFFLFDHSSSRFNVVFYD